MVRFVVRQVVAGEVVGSARGSGAWADRHVQAVDGWARQVPVTLEMHEHERAILDLAAGIWSWSLGAGMGEDGDAVRGGDGFGGPNVTWELVCAFRNALNFDLGRLDGGSLDAWVVSVCTRCGIDADTGAWIAGES